MPDIVIKELREQLADANSFIETLADTCESAERCALECQAREKVLIEQRNAWKDVAEHQYGLLRHIKYGDQNYYPVTGALDAWACGRHVILKFGTPTDDSALKAALAKERDVIYQFVGRDFAHLEPHAALESWLVAITKQERERCADIAESYTGKQGEHDGTAIAHAIRDLGD